MHTVVLPKSLATARPDLTRAVYTAVCQAKDQALGTYQFGQIFNHGTIVIPW